MATYELRYSRPVWDDPRNAWRVTGELSRDEKYLGVVHGLVSPVEIEHFAKYAPDIAADCQERMGPALLAHFRRTAATIGASRWTVPMTIELTHVDLAAVTPEALRDDETVCTFEH